MEHVKIQEGCEIELRLKIPVEKTLTIITAHTEKVFRFTRYNVEKPFIGRVKGSRFYLYRNRNYNKKFFAVLNGQVAGTEYGCLIRAQFNTIKWFMIVWLSFAAIMLLFGVGVFVKGVVTDSLGPEVFMAIGIPLGLLTFGFFFFRAGVKFNKLDQQQLEKEFLSLFDSVCHYVDG